jgi:serine/threonine protein kinase
MDTKQVCKACGALLPADAPQGLCPNCLLKVAMGSEAGNPAASVERKSAPPPEEIAKRFPQFEILTLLGQGGMGAVYKARQPALDRFVALKVLPPQSAADAGFAERFNREARALAKLSHPNIVAVYEFGQTDGLHYLVMEYVDGLNLRQLKQTGNSRRARRCKSFRKSVRRSSSHTMKVSFIATSNRRTCCSIKRAA